MPWIQIDSDLVHHRKTKRLKRLLSLDGPTTVGALVCLWSWALDNAEDGLLPKEDATTILSDVMELKIPGEESVAAMIQSGFLDDRGSNLYLHDWIEHMGAYIRKRQASRERKQKSAKVAQGLPKVSANREKLPREFAAQEKEKEEERNKQTEDLTTSKQKSVVSTSTSGGWLDLVEPWTKSYPPVMAVDELIGLSPEQIKAYDQRDREWREQHGMKA